ncbi:hypothetical protein GCM10027416_07540 [Okibacterium endophyticum]
MHESATPHPESDEPGSDDLQVDDQSLSAPRVPVTDAGGHGPAAQDSGVAEGTGAENAETPSAGADRGSRRRAFAAGGGIGAYFSRHRRGWTAAAGVVGFALLGSGAVAAGAATAGPAPVAAPLNTETNTPTATPTPDPRPVLETSAQPLRTCSVLPATQDPRFGHLQAQVLDAATGELLFERDPATPSPTASSMKVLTAAAGLAVLGPDFRMTTRVVVGTEPGTIVLVGGGDVTLTRLPTGQEPVYAGAAHLDALAQATLAAWEASGHTEPISRIVLDSNYFGGETWDPSWPATERQAGWLSHITALQVDADRADPQVFLSPRGEDPIGRAGSAFASYFGGVTVERGAAPVGAAELASAQSQPLTTLIPQFLIPSDNTLAEAIARIVAITLGTGNTLQAQPAAIAEGLQGYGIDTAGINAYDGSGMSPNNAVPPSYFTKLFLKINAREGNLGAIYDGLAVSGETGTLNYSNRFFGDNAVARGKVYAKSGSITSAYTLNGIIYAEDGSTLVFSIYGTGPGVSSGTRTAIDTLTTAFYRCGLNLSNN